MLDSANRSSIQLHGSASKTSMTFSAFHLFLLLILADADAVADVFIP